MAKFLKSAEISGDVAGSLRACGVSLVDYSRSRKTDPIFRAACVELDSAIRESVVTSLTLKASEGNVRAAALLEKTLGLIEPDASERQPWPEVVPSWIRAELVKTWLKAIGEPVPDFDPPVCRFCHAEGRLDPDPTIRYRSGWVVHLPRGAEEIEGLEKPTEGG